MKMKEKEDKSKQRMQKMKRRMEAAEPHPPPHAVQGGAEVLLAEGVPLSEDLTLLQSHRHRRAVLGALTARQTDSIHQTTNLHKRTY